MNEFKNWKKIGKHFLYAINKIKGYMKGKHAIQISFVHYGKYQQQQESYLILAITKVLYIFPTIRIVHKNIKLLFLCFTIAFDWEQSETE
jgi:hypothetical protein